MYMVIKMPYKDLTHSLKYLKKQVLDSYNYACEVCPEFTNPEDLFNWLKLRTTYVSDPRGMELFQHMQTLLEGNYHGIAGGGDCDCFTIATLACALANGWGAKKGTEIGIVLVGRSPWQASHIYSYIDWLDGCRYYLDLTNKRFNHERYYPYKQHLKFYVN